MTIASILALYLAILNFKYPLIGIDIEKEPNGHISVSRIYEFGWANGQDIDIHEQVLWSRSG